MNARKHGLANIVAVGVVVLLLMSLGLFWARCFCGTVRHQVLLQAGEPVVIGPARVSSAEGQGDPNLLSVSTVRARTSATDPLLAGLGIMRYEQTRSPGGSRSRLYRYETELETQVYYDPSRGQMVYQAHEDFRRRDGTRGSRYVTFYVGPEGMSETPDAKLGRFTGSLVAEFARTPWLVYDRGLRRFFAIRPEQRTVAKGPPLPVGDTHRPVQIGMLSKNPLALQLLTLPVSEAPDSSTNALAGEAGKPRLTSVARGFPSPSSCGTLVLDASGQIDLLDVDTLTLVRTVGRLPKPATLFPPRTSVTPQDVAAYAVDPVVMLWRDGTRRRWVYAGCSAAALSSDATAVRVEVFDPNGKVMASGETEFAAYVRSDEHRAESADPVSSAYLNVPGAAPVTGLKFALESLHPPVFLLLSYLTAPHFEATAGYRSLLFLPSSFVAMKARDTRVGPVSRFMAGGMLMLPAFVLAVVLAGLVARDGAQAGLTKNARTMWAAGTLVFGLPAYITYRLTRPSIRMVTCQNCGQMRRPDQERCHQCGSAWVVPELTPPAWRVCDEGSSADGGWETEQTQPGTAVPRGDAAAETP